jgi:hypothetical protein
VGLSGNTPYIFRKEIHRILLSMTTQFIAHAGRGGFETRPYGRTLTGMFAIYVQTRSVEQKN